MLSAVLLRLVKYDCQRLNSLAETHVVTKGAVQVERTELCHPVDTLQLVVPQLDVFHLNHNIIVVNNLVFCKDVEEVYALLDLLLETLIHVSFRLVDRRYI